MRYVFLLLLQFFLNYNTLAKETVSDNSLSIYLDSLKKLRRDYQITGYNLYKFLGKNSPVRNSSKKKIDKYFGINTELLGTLDLIINKKEYPSLYLAAEEPFYPSDFWGDSYNNFDGESASEESFYPSDFWGDSYNNFDGESASDAGTLVAENSADSNQQNAAVSVNGAQQSENPEEEDEENEENEDDETEEDDESDENADSEEAEIQPQPSDAANSQLIANVNTQPLVNPQDVAVINPQSDVIMNPQSVVPANQQPAENPQTETNQLLPPLDENSQQYQGDVFIPTDDLPATNQLLPSLDENFQQYQGTPNNGLLGQINIESAGFQSDNGNWENQNNSNQDQLGNFLRKAQLAKNIFIGDLDRYGNSYDNEYYEQYQGNSDFTLRQSEIENANMNSDRLNYRESDFINEAQIVGENQATNNQLRNNSVIYSANLNNANNSREAEVQPAAADNDLPNSEPAENSSDEEENNSAERNSVNDTDAGSPAGSVNDENINADADEDEDEGRTVSESSGTAPIARQTRQTSSFAPQTERFVGRFVPQSRMPQPRMPQSRMPRQNSSFSYADQSDYEADSESYDDSNPSENSSANQRINSQNAQISDSDVKTQPVSDGEDRGNNYVPSEMTESEISNHEDSSQLSNSDRVESDVDEMSSNPRYLNEFDQFADSPSQDSVISGESEMPVVQAPKKSDDEPVFIVPDTSDGRLHINHF